MSSQTSDERISVVPMTLRAAFAYVKEKHRHAKKIQGGLFAVGAEAATAIKTRHQIMVLRVAVWHASIPK